MPAATMPARLDGPRTALLPTRLAGLDGLRAVAVLLVVGYHFLPGAFPGGYNGVDVFFVISGFLISTLLIAEHKRDGRISLRRFWQRRARRLLPALAALLLLVVPLAGFLGGDVLVHIRAQLAGALTFSSNWVQIATGSDYFGADAPVLLQNLWSLAVEEQFYILWPLLALALLPRVRRRTLIAGALIASALSGAGMFLVIAAGALSRAYYGTDTHSFGLLLGAALALLASGGRGAIPARLSVRRSDQLGIVAGAVILVLALSVTGSDAVAMTGGLGLTSVGAAILIATASRPGSRLGQRLDVQPLRWIGTRSYAIYLWHWPVLVLLESAAPQAHRAVLLLLAFALTLLAAGLSGRFLEDPLRRHGLRASVRALLRRVRGRTSARIGALLVIAALLAGTSGTVFAAAAENSETRAEQHVRAGGWALITAQAQGLVDWARGDPRATGTEVSAIGDSVMLASAGGLAEVIPGITVDADVSRNFGRGLEILRAAAADGSLRRVVVLGLGTNATVTMEQLDAARTAIGPERSLVLVTAYADRDWVPGVNDALHRFDARYRNVVLADWARTIEPHAVEMLAGDGIHPGEQGGRLYAETVEQALDHLSTPLGGQ